ncbi:zinc finger CCCH domain-containing protein 62 [Prunus avium]|uniref:Zinc finger CCCH domain-containing protein 62 n=1 Tax=Prunus avium TaxID=42229 RepID=A0A6P5TD56_PRUAV|nr:zinc finger CCCH domain-containing protein 62 [Prunus avium]
MAGREGKRAFICISSSSEEEEEDDDNDQVEDSGTEEEEEDDGDEGDNDDYNDEQEDDDADEQIEEGDDEALCNKVIRSLNEGSDLDSLNLKECKAYLRRNGLRISGTKSVCIQRIEEHQRLKDGNGEALYPKSSFVVNCTGDVCKGDVVLFTQKVYEKFDKVRRYGRILGKRTVAGRIAKESYGAAKQQHTFTVEVLWSRGIKKLCPLFPLLVKGRNLYRLRTFRQRWSNEAERSKVLAEKHRRGEVARRVRAMKKSKKSAANGGVKRQKQSHFTRPNQIRKNNESEKGKHLDRLRKRTSRGSANHNSFFQHRAALPSKQLTLQQSAMSKASQCFSRHQNPACFNIDRVPALHSQPVPQIPLQSQLEFQHRSAPFQSFSHAMNSNSTMLRYSVTTNVDTLIQPASQFQRFSNSNCSHNGYVVPGYNLENWDHLPGVNFGRRFHPYISGADTNGQMRMGQR